MVKPFKGGINTDIRESTPERDAFLPDRAPEGAPNVLVILYDDTGLAAWSPFGGRIEMPTDGGDAVSSKYESKFEFTAAGS
jgi:hypothetical protein